MASETSGRPRPWLLVLLAVSVAALVLTKMWPTGAAVSGVPTSTVTRPAAARSGAPAKARVEPGDLVIHLEALATPRPALGNAERNPFRFRPLPPPPPPPGPKITAPIAAPPPPPPPLPPGPPPITLKFIGTIEKQGLKVAALSDCRTTYHGTEGQIIDGRYRLVSIGVESIVLEYVDGRGRTTVRLDGCSPR
jgi:hypothetical protein